MEFLSRLLGASYTPRKTPPKPVNDAQSRLSRYNRILSSITQLCNNKRDLAREVTTLNELQPLFDRLTQVIRDESRAAQPHPCVQHVASQQVYALINRAASISFHQGCIRSAIALMSALVDSEEESFLSNRGFAKSLMRLVTRAIDNEDIDLTADTESLIFELLFTIAAKIRLQPDILPCWFTLTRRLELDFEEEKSRNGLGGSRSQDFPLCFILVDRIYKEGRTGDFARTALLYLFEATSKSGDLATYMVESSICTLMASGLGALYSQLSRELSILHPDAVLPPVLAMSDYTTPHTQASSAESAFNELHVAHMTTLMSYLFFWVDILEHVKRSDVKQALLDNFEILFLQQLLYPSILQSSDIDAGSAIAILTYLEAIVSGVEHPALIDTILSYILAIERKDVPPQGSSGRTEDLEQSVTSLHRRESLLAMTQSQTLQDVVEPTLFTLADLIQNSLGSTNPQTVFAALRLSSTIIRRQSKYAFNTMLKLGSADLPKRPIGVVSVELDRYMRLAGRIQPRFDAALVSLIDDTRLHVENALLGAVGRSASHSTNIAQSALLSGQGAFVPKLMDILGDFFSNPVDVNLALTHSLIATASLANVRLDGWICLNVPAVRDTGLHQNRVRLWHQYLADDELDAFSAMKEASVEPEWPTADVPSLYIALTTLVQELETAKESIPNLDALLSARKLMLQVPGSEDVLNSAVSLPATPLVVRISPSALREADPPSPSPGPLSPARGRSQEGRLDAKQSRTSSRASTELRPSPASRRQSSERRSTASPTSTPSRVRAGLDARQVFRPPPPETPSTTDVLMQKIELSGPRVAAEQAPRTITLNHLLTNAVILQEFILEIVAVLQVRASLLADVELQVS